MATFTQDIFEIPEIGSLLEAESVTEERLLELAEVHELEEVLLDDLRSRLVEADVTIIKGEDDEATAIEKRALSDHAVSAELPSDLTRHFINRASRHKILTLVGVTLISFLMTYLLPGNPALVQAGPYATPAYIAEMEQRMGLDQPVYVQYWRYVSGLATAGCTTSSPT